MQEDEGFNCNSLIPKTYGLALMTELVELGESDKFEKIVDGEKVKKVVDESCAGVKFDEGPLNINEAESSVLVTENFQILTKEVINNAFQFVLPPDVFKSFAGFFEEEENYDDLHFGDDEKEPIEEIIDVTQEMNVETLT
ncbi:hypothetical protein Hanom_Chr01g00060891 [Helianthus anomalus]